MPPKASRKGGKGRRSRTSADGGGAGGKVDEAAVDSSGAGIDGYPSTPHLPFSPEVHSDDTKVSDSVCAGFVGKHCVVTEKLDGGNCCLKAGLVYARTHGHAATHASFGPIKQLCERVYSCGLLADDVAIFGENMFGIHSIEYDDLDSFFYLFSTRDSDGVWRPWAEVVELADTLGVPTAPVVFEGEIESVAHLRRIMDDAASKVSAVAHDAGADSIKPEGFVVRISDGFRDEDFTNGAIAKYVRKGHLQTDASWLRTWKKAQLHSWKKAKK